MDEFADDLAQVYGAFPARQSLQTGMPLAAMAGELPRRDLQVFVDGLAIPTIPTTSSAMPNFLKASDTYATFGAKYQSTAWPGHRRRTGRPGSRAAERLRRSEVSVAKDAGALGGCCLASRIAPTASEPSESCQTQPTRTDP